MTFGVPRARPGMRVFVYVLGWLIYVVAFALPSWHDCCSTYVGFQAFIWALLGVALIAWLANPLIWIAGLLRWRARRATGASVVCAGAAILLAVAGTLWFRSGQALYEEPMIGVYAWVIGQALVAASLLYEWTRTPDQRSVMVSR